MRILLADANPEVRSALRLVLEQRSDIQVIGEARDTVNLFAQVARCCPDLVLVDMDLPGLQSHRRSAQSSLVEMVEALRLLCASAKIIVMSSRPNAEKECRLAKADAFLCKSDPPDVVVNLLHNQGQPGETCL